jgi:osmotically-inducible protein OsmY
MNTVLRVATAFAAGVAAMYFLDPATGRRRRTQVRDQGVAAGHDLEDFARAKSKRVVDHAQGALARTRSRLSTEPVDDQQLHEQIRTRLGRLVERPGEVKVDVNDGHVVLRGKAAPAEIEDLMATIAAMRGVTDIDSRLSADDGSQPRQQTGRGNSVEQRASSE